MTAPGGRTPRWALRLADWWLRLAGLNLHGERRAMWLREWRAELWHAALGGSMAPAVTPRTGPMAAASHLFLQARGAWSDARAFRRYQGSEGSSQPSGGWGGSWWYEVRVAARSLRRSPSFALMAIVTLAVAIAANLAIFRLIDTVLLRPLPYPTAERLVSLRHPVPGYEPDWVWGMSVAGFYHVRERSTTLDELGAYTSISSDIASVESGGGLGGAEAPERIHVAIVSAGMMRVLGARPAVGRIITPDDDVPDGPNVIVLSHDLWARRYGADPRIVGTSVAISGRPYEVIGVMAKGISLPDRDTDVWSPWGLDPARPAVNSHYLNVLGLLTPEASVPAARAEVATIVKTFPDVFPQAYSPEWIEFSGFQVALEPLRDDVVGDTARILWVLWGSVGLVLVLAAANVANLFLVRTEGRRRDFALRAALGASRAALARHFFVESLLLTGIAGAAGLALGVVGLQPVLALFPDSLPRLRELESGVSLSLVGLTAALSLLLAVCLGLLPLFRFRRDGLLQALASVGRGMSEDRAGRFATRVLVGAQVAVALMLLVGAFTSFAAFRRLQEVDPGFDPAGAITFHLALPSARYPDAKSTARFYGDLTARLTALPGVRAAGATTDLPMEGGIGCAATLIEGRLQREGEPLPCPNNKLVSPGYLEALGATMVAGESYDRREFDRPGGVVVVNERFAERFWPNESALGKGIKTHGDNDSPWYRVVGVVGDIRSEGLDQAAPEMLYLPLMAQDSAPRFGTPRSMNVVARVADGGDVSALLRTIPSVVRDLDPGIAIAGLRTLDEVVADSTAQANFMMTLLLLAAVIALLLGTVGLYGVVSYTVGRRRGEMGIRLALGARPAQVHRLVMGQAMVMVAVGIVVGLVGTIAAGPVVRGMFFQAEVASALTILPVAALLLGVAMVAAHVPARRAAGTDPAECLRAET